ncbi:MAG: hypothetical protein GX939_03475, partial [Clostridiaceae bacterium]|nr:hypothetical protein [Clostridiaceae bacterium]
DLHENERQGADTFFGVLFGAFNTAGMDLYALRSIERFTGKDDVFQRKLGIFGLDHASEVRDFPIVEGFFAADIFSKISSHMTSLMEYVMLFVDSFPTRAPFSCQ